MCGITGKFNFHSDRPIDPDLIRRMTDSIQHRGPDADGYYMDEQKRVGFGHRRLSIIDLVTGQQPMSDGDGTVWIIFNGEIYNFPELRAELVQKGHRFRTTSDTEAIIHLYKEYGESGFARLNGIFAFALYDTRSQCVILARDHFGVKPLYYTIQNGSLIFGSEIKAILQDASVPKELDIDAFHTFLTFRYNPSPETMMRAIKKLHPGYYLKIAIGGEPSIRSYWEYRPKLQSGISEADAVDEYSRLLEKAVRRQMLSDVPVGLMLSGGIDSAVIGCLMQKAAGDKIKTFTIGFEGTGDYNELEDARVSAEHIGSEHYGVTISSQEYLDFFVRSFHYTEEPIAEATIPALYYVSKLAASHLKVVLAGQGADEPLAGYHRYIGERYLGTYGPLLRLLPLSQLSNLLPRNERFKRAAYASRFTDELDRLVRIYTIFTPHQKAQLVRSEIRHQFHNNDRRLVEHLYAQTGGLVDPLSKLLFIDTRLSLSDNLLIFGDKMTMANSLEMRVPFLDIELVSFLESLPSTFKLRGREGKYIHKQALRRWLPQDIIRRKKRGFSTPMDHWLQGDLAGRVQRLVNERGSASSKYFNLPFINSMLVKHQQRKENFQRHIFALLSFELWHRTFLEGGTVDPAMLTRP